MPRWPQVRARDAATTLCRPWSGELEAKPAPPPTVLHCGSAATVREQPSADIAARLAVPDTPQLPVPRAEHRLFHAQRPSFISRMTMGTYGEPAGCRSWPLPLAGPLTSTPMPTVVPGVASGLLQELFLRQIRHRVPHVRPADVGDETGQGGRSDVREACAVSVASGMLDAIRGPSPLSPTLALGRSIRPDSLQWPTPRR